VLRREGRSGGLVTVSAREKLHKEEQGNHVTLKDEKVIVTKIAAINQI
jgi:hypothetical protein